MSELIAFRVCLSALVARSREIGNDERGGVTTECTVLTVTVVALAITVLVLGILKLTRLLAGS